MICSCCGKEVPDTKKFCPYCMMPLIDHTVKAKETEELNRADLAKDIKNLEPEFIRIREERKKKREEERKRKEELAKKMREFIEDEDFDFEKESNEDEEDDDITSILKAMSDEDEEEYPESEEEDEFGFDEEKFECEMEPDEEANKDLGEDPFADVISSLFNENNNNDEKNTNVKESTPEIDSVSGIILNWDELDSKTFALTALIDESEKILYVHLDPSEGFTNSLFVSLLNDPSLEEIKLTIKFLRDKNTVVSISDGVITYKFKSL